MIANGQGISVLLDGIGMDVLGLRQKLEALQRELQERDNFIRLQGEELAVLRRQNEEASQQQEKLEAIQRQKEEALRRDLEDRDHFMMQEKQTRAPLEAGHARPKTEVVNL